MPGDGAGLGLVCWFVPHLQDVDDLDLGLEDYVAVVDAVRGHVARVLLQLGLQLQRVLLLLRVLSACFVGAREQNHFNSSISLFAAVLSLSLHVGPGKGPKQSLHILHIGRKVASKRFIHLNKQPGTQYRAIWITYYTVKRPNSPRSSRRFVITFVDFFYEKILI